MNLSPCLSIYYVSFASGLVGGKTSMKNPGLNDPDFKLLFLLL